MLLLLKRGKWKLQRRGSGRGTTGRKKKMEATNIMESQIKNQMGHEIETRVIQGHRVEWQRT